MTITRNNEISNFEVLLNCTRKKLGFTKWIEVHDLARKLKSKAATELLSNLASKLTWVRNTAEKLNIPLPTA